jgi:putative CocE/NonD family hydrolase
MAHPTRTVPWLLLLTLGLLLAPPPSRAGADEPDWPKTTYTFKTVGDTPIRADVYRAADARPRPVVVWLHGGALIVGSRTGVPKQLLDLCRQEGYVLVSFDYRLAPEVKLAAIAEDVQDGFRWLREEGPRLFHAEPHRLVVTGGSAGGYLTLLTGVLVRPRPSALVAYWGYGDVNGDWYVRPSEYYRTHVPLIERDDAYRAVGGKVLTGTETADEQKARGRFYQYLRQNGLWTKEVTGFDPARQRAELDPYCPVRNVTPAYPPTLLVHGTTDDDVPYEQSVAMAKELARRGVPHEFVTVPGAGHGLAGGDRKLVDAAHEKALAFIRKQLEAVPEGRGDVPEGGRYSVARYEVHGWRGERVRMRDGVHLSVDVYRPSCDVTYPAILVQTPYSNNQPALVERARWFARRGYGVVLADVRGRYDSDGDWDPFDPKHKTDGYDLVEWLARQSWCDGKVGLLGASYLGWTQWWTATQAPPALKAMVPEVAPPDAFANAPYQEGVLSGWMMDWAAMMSGRTAQTVGDGPYGGFATTRARDFLVTPYLGLNERRGALDAPWFDKWLRQNRATDPYWQAIAYQRPEDYARVAVPSLAVTGWFDANHPGSPRNYLGVKEHGRTPEARRPHLVIGPWPHGFNRTRRLSGVDYGPDALLDWDGCVCRWFDHFLKGEDNGVEREAPVHVFVMGRNRWYAEPDWPLPQTKWVRYYLHSGGRANSLEGDGSLGTTPPADEPADTYTYDPNRPTKAPFTGGHLEDGPADTRAAAAGAEVLVYTTPPLEEDVEVTGPVEAKLYAATSARDTDWMVRLIDVAPDGRAGLLCDGVLRARCRDPQHAGAFTAEKLATLTPNEVYEYTIRFWRGTGNVFLKGHRIRVEVSSSYFPYYLRNLNGSGDNVALETVAVAARQKVYHDGRRPSHVVLPVIPARP